MPSLHVTLQPSLNQSPQTQSTSISLNNVDLKFVKRSQTLNTSLGNDKSTHNVLGHSWVLQGSWAVEFPSHVPPSRASHLNVLVFVLVPPAHDFEHFPTFQSFHLQLIGSKIQIVFKSSFHIQKSILVTQYWEKSRNCSYHKTDNFLCKHPRPYHSLMLVLANLCSCGKGPHTL